MVCLPPSSKTPAASSPFLFPCHAMSIARERTVGMDRGIYVMQQIHTVVVVVVVFGRIVHRDREWSCCNPVGAGNRSLVPRSCCAVIGAPGNWAQGQGQACGLTCQHPPPSDKTATCNRDTLLRLLVNYTVHLHHRHNGDAVLWKFDCYTSGVAQLRVLSHSVCPPASARSQIRPPSCPVQSRQLAKLQEVRK